MLGRRAGCTADHYPRAVRRLAARSAAGSARCSDQLSPRPLCSATNSALTCEDAADRGMGRTLRKNVPGSLNPLCGLVLIRAALAPAP